MTFEAALKRALKQWLWLHDYYCVNILRVTENTNEDKNKWVDIEFIDGNMEVVLYSYGSSMGWLCNELRLMEV